MSQRGPSFGQPFLLDLSDLLVAHEEPFGDNLPRFQDGQLLVLGVHQGQEDFLPAWLRQSSQVRSEKFSG